MKPPPHTHTFSSSLPDLICHHAEPWEFEIQLQQFVDSLDCLVSGLHKLNVASITGLWVFNTRISPYEHRHRPLWWYLKMSFFYPIRKQKHESFIRNWSTRWYSWLCSFHKTKLERRKVWTQRQLWAFARANHNDEVKVLKWVEAR